MSVELDGGTLGGGPLGGVGGFGDKRGRLRR